MKKIMPKMKKIVFSIGIAMMLLPGKIFAKINEKYYDPAEYGVVNPKAILLFKILKIINIFVIPIALIIGAIVYFKKSKSSKKKKISVSIGVIILTVLGIFTINAIIYLNEHL